MSKPKVREVRKREYKVLLTQDEDGLIRRLAETAKLRPSAYLRSAGLRALSTAPRPEVQKVGLDAEAVRELSFIGLQLHEVGSQLSRCRQLELPLNWHEVAAQLRTLNSSFDRITFALL